MKDSEIFDERKLNFKFTRFAKLSKTYKPVQSLTFFKVINLKSIRFTSMNAEKTNKK